jgi:hypothetical protein
LSSSRAQEQNWLELSSSRAQERNLHEAAAWPVQYTKFSDCSEVRLLWRRKTLRQTTCCTFCAFTVNTYMYSTWRYRAAVWPV